MKCFPMIRKNMIIYSSAFFAALITFIVYLPTLKNNFINWDDDLYVYNNPNIKNISIYFFKWVSTAIVSGNWHPLTMLTYALDYRFWGIDPWGYHLTNSILHSLNTVLVFILSVQLIRKGIEAEYAANMKIITAASVTALLFGIHPLHVESVAWVSERKDVLCAFFYLLSILAYLRFAGKESSNRKLFYSLSLLVFILALLSKPMAVSLPMVLIILDYYPLGRLDKIRAVMIEKIPFFLFSLLSSIITIHAQRAGGLLQDMETFPFLTRLYVATWGYIFYLYKMLFPIYLSPLYPYPMKTDLFNIKYSGSLALFIMLIFFGIWAFKNRRFYFAIICYYIITLLPVIGLVQVGAQAAADRYTYLPSLGPFLLAGLVVGHVTGVITKKSHKLIILLVLCSTLILLGYKTTMQINKWSDSIILWSSQLMYTRGINQEYKAYINRGDAYLDMRAVRKAIDDYNEGINLNPGYGRAYYKRAEAYTKLGNNRQALKDFEKAIKLTDNKANAFHRRGRFNLVVGYYEDAVSDFSQAINYDLKDAVSYYNRGLAYNYLGNYIRAIEDFSCAIDIDPFFAKAYSNRGAIYGRLKRSEEARRDFEMAVRLDPEDGKAHFNLGMVNLKSGNIEKARINLKRAAALGIKEAEIQLKRLKL